MKQGEKEFNKCSLQDSVYLLKVGWVFGSELSSSHCEKGNVISYKIHKFTVINKATAQETYIKFLL